MDLDEDFHRKVNPFLLLLSSFLDLTLCLVTPFRLLSAPLELTATVEEGTIQTSKQLELTIPCLMVLKDRAAHKGKIGP